MHCSLSQRIGIRSFVSAMALAKRAQHKASNGRGGGRARGGGRGRGGGRVRGVGRDRGRQALPWQLRASLCATGGRCGKKLWPMETSTAVDASGVNRQFVKVEQRALELTRSVINVWLNDQKPKAMPDFQTNS